MEYIVQVPPLTANIGQACYSCFKDQQDLPRALSRCSSCLRVSYCGPACQKENWPKHKAMCKAFKALRTKYPTVTTSEIGTGITEPEQASPAPEINKYVQVISGREMSLVTEELRRRPRMEEQNLIAWEPHCLACGCSDLTLLIQASIRGQNPPSPIKACPDCRLSFYCSDSHWNAVKNAHKNAPCVDGHDGLSQCGMNKLCIQDARLGVLMAGAGEGTFQWAPERTKTAWQSVLNIGWDDFKDELMKTFGSLPPHTFEPMLRLVTDALSMPMTILWALESLNENDSWTRKETLTIHILGAADKEVLNARVFEEILHRLPQVKTLLLVLCGPELNKISSNVGSSKLRMDMDTCPACTRGRRKRVHEHHASTYHDYVDIQGSSYEKPDLAIAFNSGCSEEDPASWRETIEVLVRKQVPTVFTSYNKHEAEAENAILSAMGATLYPELGPKQKPWASLLAKTEPNKVTGYYANNGWIAGMFCGGVSAERSRGKRSMASTTTGS